MDTSMHTPTQPSKRSTASTPTNDRPTSACSSTSMLEPAVEGLTTPCSSRPSYFSRGGGTMGGGSHGSGSGPRRNQFRPGRFPVRSNPFDCNITMIDKLQRPVLSPSLFNIVQSPNSESTSSSGRFWTIDQQSNLFPVEISDDSPWKQETAHSVMDPELENRTQEAINRYFNQTHDLKSPPDLPVNHSQINSTTLPMDTGASPILRPMLAQSIMDNSSRRSSVDGNVKTTTTQYTQTVMSFPSELPESFEAQLATYFTFFENQRAQHKVISEISTGPSSQQNSSQVQQPMDEQQNNLSTSRRKLFDCGPPDFEEEEEDAFSDRDEDETPHHWMSSPVKRLPSALDHHPGQSSEGEDVEHHFLIPRLMDVKTPTNPIVRSSTWSSGSKEPGTPQYRHRTSVSPAASMGSPTFSPIGPGNSTSILMGSFSRQESASHPPDSNKENVFSPTST
ncbi:hypothetical protein TCAL_09758 [Tigriopus californicus]|uniref:Uncharacterized protein n=1 Tax=Tigriopus californicus TaxID=6832 RepID=A0A553PC73_TIGCA|nr:uncharacterized protein LOC131892953 [Tigriopus californicus]TRY75286.1 hypothetical protein TCAL_09758 [Tigriopus californicus]